MSKKWSSYKEAQLMTESWRKYLAEDEEESLDEGLKQKLASIAAAGAMGAAALGGGGPSSTPPQTDPTAELGDPVRWDSTPADRAEAEKAAAKPRIFPDGSKRLQPLAMIDLAQEGKVTQDELTKFFKEEIKWINIAHKDIGTDRMDAFRAVAEPDGKWHSAFGGPEGNWNEEKGGPVEHETGTSMIEWYKSWM